MNQGLLLVDVDNQTGKPLSGALVGLGTITADGHLLPVFKPEGGIWINPHLTTGSDGMAMFYFGWDETQIGDTTSDVRYQLNISSAPPYTSFSHYFGELALVVDMENIYSGRLPSFRSPTSLISALLKAYLKYIESKIPLPASLALKAGKLSPQQYGLIGIMQVRM